MSESIKLGDVVELKSGSPKMTVVIVGADGLSVWCTWYDFNTNTWRESIKFPNIALKVSL